MKKQFLVALAFLLSMSLASMASVDKYVIDDSAVEAVFASSTMISADILSTENSFSSLSATASSDKSALVAIVLDFFVGGLGIHRVYLGGKGILVFGYIITGCGIFGLVPFIDLIVLAINYNDISKYVNNNKYFMW